MKILALFASLCAIASAGHYAAYSPAYYYGHGYGYHGPLHLPVIGPGGVPLEPPANVAARVQHAHAVVEAKARNAAAYIHDTHAGLYGHAGYAGYAGHHGYAGYGGYAGHYGHYLGPIHVPIIGPGGVPLEPPANVAARAQHAHAHVEAKVRNAAHAYGGLYGVHAGLGYPSVGYGHGYGYHVPVIGPHGVPIEPPANQAARAFHAAAHAAAAAHAHHPWGRKRRSIYGYGTTYHGPLHIPIIGPSGVPLEPPANVAARAQHAAAHAHAAGHGGAVALYSPAAALAVGHGIYSPLAAVHGLASSISHHGLPVDTPEVAAAKAAHFAAHAAAAAHAHY